MTSIDTGLFTADDGSARCRWCEASEPYRRYHDHEWGFPVTDDRRLFEKLCLEGFQAGLSWLTILNKRESFRAGFANFDAERVARFDAADVTRLLADAGIATTVHGAVADTDPRHRALLAWVLREAVTNVVRHARAGSVVIELGPRGISDRTLVLHGT